MLAGRFAIRVCITNHRTANEDLDVLVEAVAAICAEMLAPTAPVLTEATHA